MAFVLPELPYAKDAFGSVLSAETFDYHHGKHHNAYVTQANDQVKGTELEGKSLLDVIAAAKAAGNKKLFNASAQIWNHTFYWLGLSPEKQAPSEALAAKIDADLGGIDALKAALKAESAGHFASGWGWLVLEDGKLKVTSFHDADTPVAYEGVTPLFTLDVWEHAYYVDYRNARPNYLDALLDHVNWAFVEDNLAGTGAAKADQQG
ncbi:MAG TPA: superoxide dismutase [Novosphingobium sp.]|nr:superoxide dismutase [Novosphingobium sp.]HZV11085.1 superoxide dismutase [Novosphingobium sp.]